MPVKVVHLATQDVGGGGGGFDAAHRLHANMRNAGVDSAMLVHTKRSTDDHVTGVSDRLTIPERLRSKLGERRVLRDRKRGGYSNYFKADIGFFLPAQRLMRLLPFKPDAIIAHWVSGFVTADMLRQLCELTGAPLYWYLMDMAPLTGGCHYAFDCKGYFRACGHCPQIGSDAGEFDVSRRQLQNKMKSFEQISVTAVASSTWVRRQAEQSAVFSARPIRHIMLGMDANVFKPAPVATSRAVLGLPVDRTVLFFGAQQLSEKRKGFGCLVEALNRLWAMLDGAPAIREKVMVVTAGSTPTGGSLRMPFEHRHIGMLLGNERLTAAYTAADIFINASTEDTGPMMINEAILCGTPVVAFDMGVAPDLVHTHLTGYRARLRDTGDMAEGLRMLLAMDETQMQAMRSECRDLGLRLCHPQVQVRSFTELIASGSEAGESRSEGPS